MQPCPLLFATPNLTAAVQVIDAADLMSEEPPDPQHAAFVKRDVDFWRYYCLYRLKNGAVPLRVRTANSEAHLVLRLEQAGRIRIASLLSLHLRPYSPEAARAVGRSLRQALSEIGVSAMLAT